MSVAIDHGGFSEQARQYAINQFAGRRRDSQILIAVFGFIGALLMAIAAATGNLNVPVAVFMAGNTCLTIASVFIVGWGASSGHAEVCECNAIGLEQMNEELNSRLDEISIRLNARLDEIEASDLEAIGAVRATLQDELSHKRHREN